MFNFRFFLICICIYFLTVECLGGSGSGRGGAGGYGKSSGGKSSKSSKGFMNDSSNGKTANGSTPKVKSGGRFLSAWGIISLIMLVIIGSALIYYTSIFYPLVCAERGKYDVMEMTAV